MGTGGSGGGEIAGEVKPEGRIVVSKEVGDGGGGGEVGS